MPLVGEVEDALARPVEIKVVTVRIQREAGRLRVVDDKQDVIVAGARVVAADLPVTHDSLDSLRPAEIRPRDIIAVEDALVIGIVLSDGLVRECLPGVIRVIHLLTRRPAVEDVVNELVGAGVGLVFGRFLEQGDFDRVAAAREVVRAFVVLC